MVNILTIEEVRKALYLDFDFDDEELLRYAELASSYILQKARYDFTLETTINSMAKQCAILYCKQQYFGSDGYNKEHDYGLGLSSLILDLQNIAKSKIAAAAVDVLIDLIPAVESIVLADAETIQTARDAYDDLFIVDIKYVVGLATLVAAEAKLVELGG